MGQMPAAASASCNSAAADLVQTSTGADPRHVVPAGYTKITSWSTNASSAAGQMLTLKVFRPSSGSTYTVVAHDGPRPLGPSAVNNFPVAIPVHAGDVLGLNTANAASV